MTAAERHGEMAERDRLSELTAMIRSRSAALFTGAGFSSEAADRKGQSVPDAKAMVSDLWQQRRSR